MILRCATGVTSATDQSDPSVGDAAVRKVRERARDFVRDEMRSTWGGDLLLATQGRDDRYQKLGGVAEVAENGEIMEILTSPLTCLWGRGDT